MIRKIIVKSSLFVLTFSICYLLVLFLDSLTIGIPRPGMNTVKIVPGGWDYNLRRFREIKEFEDVDLLFAGSSTCYEGFNTEFFAEKGYSSFNIGSANQTPLNTYYLLRKYYGELAPKVIVMDVSWENLTSPDGLEGFAGLLVNLPESTEMIEMGLATHSIYAVNTIIREYLFSRASRPYAGLVQLETINSKYYRGGYVERSGFQKDDLSGLPQRKIEVNERQVKYLKKILSEFNNNNTEIVMMTQCFPAELVNSITNYAEINSMLKSIADKYKVRYIDYNDKIVLNSNTDYYDSYHLNAEGAYKYNIEVLSDLQNIIQYK